MDVVVVACAAVAIALLTLLVVLVRAGGDPSDAANWLVNWELRSSDNGTLFQVLQDVAAGRPLDWSFSPQVYVFPELPISALAFALTGGSIYGYYVAVAVLNNTVLFLVLLALVRVLFKDERMPRSALRAVVATAPLLILPLIGTSWILSFHLAPTYYFGEYAALFAAPVLLLARRRWARVALGVALALTIASNPLAAVFAAPGVAAVMVLHLARSGWRATVPAILGTGGVLVAALGIRLAFFTPLQGTSPFTYVDPQVFAGRLATIGPYYDYQARDPAMRVVMTLGLVLAVVALVAAVVAAVRFVPRRHAADPRLLAVVFLGLVPLGGLGATAALLITHYLYFWPVLVMPLVLAMLAVPRVALPTYGAVGGAVFLAVALVTGAPGNLTHVDRYVGFRNAETRCLDALPTGQDIGYATFSDARRLSLTSGRGLRLIQVGTDAQPNYWLTNRTYAHTEVGTFFYINARGDELPIDLTAVIAAAGEPDETVDCGDGQSVAIYNDSAKIAKIAAFYGVPNR